MKLIVAFAARNEAEKSVAGSQSARRWLCMALAAPVAAMVIGCGSGTNSSSTSVSTDPSQLYFSPRMDSGLLTTYAIDHTANTTCNTSPTLSINCNDGTFVRSTYSASGATIQDSGVIPLSPPNGPTFPDEIYGLDTTYINGGSNGTVTLSGPVAGSWAVELPGQAALVELNVPQEKTNQGGSIIPAANYFTPAVPTESCPSLATEENFQFVTIPKILASASSQSITATAWNPKLETAYGTLKISTSGSTVNFSNVSQFTLAAQGSGVPIVPAAVTATASCSPTYYGQVISIPGNSTVNSEGSITPAATIGIGPSGFLVEDAGTGNDPATGLPYENILGAGYGAIGLPQPSSDLTSSLIGAQYQGFVYAPGASGFSVIGSFGGSSSAQASCATLLGQLAAAHFQLSSNSVYGGEFAGNDPSSHTSGNCDIAIDLGLQQGGNGLYSQATVYVGTAFPENGLGSIYSFPAVAIGGQLQGKNAIFLIGADRAGSPSRSWGIYLLQLN
jgi:hypothetical protein